MTTKHAGASRTIWFGFAVILLAVAELAQEHLPVLLADVAPRTNAWITLGVGIVIIVLRFVTTSPVSLTKDPDAL